jgi:hypothetical protein
MPTIALEIEENRRRPLPSMPKMGLPPRARIGSGVALATSESSQCDNPHHWQTLVLLVPLLYNPDPSGHRKPIAQFLIDRTIREIQSLFSGYTLIRAMGWYWDEVRAEGVPDDLVRFELDGVFTGRDRCVLREWKKRLQRRFKQRYIYMKLVASGEAI